ncbi:SLC13 family permease [Desulfobacter postgatei]|uniref:Di-/tricarboxylate transporter n=1 Tax=Desulfobacter postgatei 2ac9 TaxID=879212 RepID=I5B192_9BACT|nr:SLC13 family permease [Desulfobacter postgatei]EIM63255.1 di-/tricarboxylate transporter [Desulfobacter postgatei 2ac9]
MHSELLVVTITLSLAVIFFVTNWVRSDLVAMLVILVFMVSGVLTIEQSLAGFSDPVVIIIVSMFIISEAIVHTGIAQRLGDFIIRRGGNNELFLMILIMLIVGLTGSFMSSTATAAIFIPVVMAVAVKVNLNRKRLLMPLSVGALISGMMTLVATTPNLVINKVLRSHDLEPLSFFSFTPFGVATLVVGILFMAVFGRGILAPKTDVPSGRKQRSVLDLITAYSMEKRFFRFRVQNESPIIDRSVARIPLTQKYNLKLIAFEKLHDGTWKIEKPRPDSIFDPGDVIVLVGEPEDAQRFSNYGGLTPLSPVVSEAKQKQFLRTIGIAEIMLTPDSPLLGKNLKELEFQNRYNCLVVGIRRQGQPIVNAIEQMPLAFGDVLLICTDWQAIIRLRKFVDEFLVLTLPEEYQLAMYKYRRAPLMLIILTLMVVTMTKGVFPPVTAAALAAMTLILTRCISLEAIYRVINWQAIFLIAGLLPLATALDKTGASQVIAETLVTTLSGVGPVLMLAIVFLVASTLSLFLSNTATAVLLAPIVLEASAQLHVSPQAFAMTLAIACSAAFATPIASPVNILVQEPGGYTFMDFVRVGIPLQLLSLAITVLLVSLFYL